MAFSWDFQRPPFSFKLDGLAAREAMSAWESIPAAGDADTHQVYSCRHLESGLRVTAFLRKLAPFPAWEWLLEFTHEGPADSPVISELAVLDLSIPNQRGKEGDHQQAVADAGWIPQEEDTAPVFHYAKGSSCAIDDFVPCAETLGPGTEVVLRCVGGRSSNGVLPFMNLQMPDGGYVIGIGWSGQWVARCACSGDDVVLTAGMEHLETYLHPGESIRSPRMLLIAWQGEEADIGTNLLRRVLLTHYSQKHPDGTLATPPSAHPRQLVYYFTGKVSEADHLAAIDRAAEIGLEAFWVDALWYGQDEQWSQEVGNWTVNRKRFPRGLRPLADKAHAKGMKFILWFEPERVRPGTPLARQHPEYLLKHPHDHDNLLLHLGDPAARSHITQIISEVIDEVGVDIYRQDFNLEPLEYWLAADEPGRRGMTEMRHIEGLYAMWDDLRRRHPGLLIDNCASGGRRIDLETTSRSFPLWRSDYTDAGAAREGYRCEIGAQCQTAGLSRWIPLHAAAVWRMQPYSVRSSVSTGLVFYPDIRPRDYPLADARKALAEMARLRPFFLGDHHLLVPLSAAAHDWCAHQFHRPDQDAGIAFFFRRHQSPFPYLECSLRQITPEAEYEVTQAEGWERQAPRRVSGAGLRQLAIHLPQRPSSQLLEYRRL